MIRVDDEVFALIQASSVALVDTANSTLRRLLGLDAPGEEPEEGLTLGALKPLIDSELIQTGDHLEWSRPRVGKVHRCTVDENGRLIAEDGTKYLSPSGIAVAMAGGSQPGWNVWTHLKSGQTLYSLRSSLRNGVASSSEGDRQWRQRIEQVLRLLPPGAWTSYGDLARYVERHPREVGNYLAGSRVENAFRVLQHTGKVSPQFRWADSDGPNVYERLRDVGVRLSPSLIADLGQRLHVEDLQRLAASTSK